MNIGKMRHRIIIQKPEGKSINSMGETVVLYGDFVSVWADVSPMTGREYEESQKIRAETTYKIIMRYLPGMTADMRIRYGDKDFEIVSTLNIGERNAVLQIIAVEVV